MIRFVDIRGASTGYRFAFWDTVTDRFITIGNDQAWDTVDELHSAPMGMDVSVDIDRYVGLCPAWAYKEE